MVKDLPIRSSLLNKKKLGIIGGMGPDATVYMFNKIVKKTGAPKDQDHIEIFIHNNTKVPDRTDAILYNGESPIEELLRSASILEKMGADIIIMPCITAHYYFLDIQETINVPIINAIEESVLYIKDHIVNINNVGIIATTGTVKSQLFQKSLQQRGLNPIVLADSLQNDWVMSAIYGKDGIKAGCKAENVKQKLLHAVDHLIECGAEAIIAGCTEVPLAINKSDIPVPFIDPMEVLSIIAIRKCLNRDFV